MSSNTTTGDHGINGNLNVSNSLTSSGLTISSGNVNFTGATFTSNCIPSNAVSGGGSSSSNASTITVANDASLTITNGYIPYCGVTNTNVALKTNGGLRYNAMTGTLTTTLNGNANSANTSTTQASSDNSTNIATTAFVQNAVYPLTDITYTPYTNNIYTSVGHNFSIGGNLSIPINSGSFIYTYDGSNYLSTAFNLIPKLSFLSDMSGSTIQTQLNNLSSSLSNYLTTSNASSTYATISSLSSYLTTSAASSTYAPISSLSNYLTTSAASSTYAPISSLSSYLTTANASSTYAPLTSPVLTGSVTCESLYLSGFKYYPYQTYPTTKATVSIFVLTNPYYEWYSLNTTGGGQVTLPTPTASFAGMRLMFLRASNGTGAITFKTTGAGTNIVPINGGVFTQVSPWAATATCTGFICLQSNTAGTYYWWQFSNQ